METVSLTDGILLDEDTLRVRAAVLDHRIPCLAFALEEKAHVNVWKARLGERPFRVWWREGATVIEKQVPLGHLKERLLSVTPGQKIGYVVDAVYHEENARRIVDLVRGTRRDCSPGRPASSGSTRSTSPRGTSTGRNASGRKPGPRSRPETARRDTRASVRRQFPKRGGKRPAPWWSTA